MPRASAGDGATRRSVRLATAIALTAGGLLTITAPSPAAAAEPAGRIVFADTELYTINADGTRRTRLARLGTGWDLEDLAVNPAGTRVAFASAHDGSAEIWAMDTDGTDLKRLTTGGGNERPTFSPDGARIAYVRLGDIWTMNADGTGATRLTTDHSSYAPAFSSDGTRIAFEDGNGIAVMDADGTDATSLGDGNHPAFSPDGSKIVFIGYDDGPILSVMDADGTDRVQLLPQAGQSLDHPAFSPDGSRIVVEVNGENLYVMKTDGSAAKQLTRAESRPAWLPGKVADPPAVNPTIAISASATTLKVGRELIVSARLVPKVPEHAKASLQRYVGDTWRTIATLETSQECCGDRAAASGREFYVKLDKAGSWKLRVVRPASGDRAQLASKTLTVRAVPGAYAVKATRTPATAVAPLAPVTFSGSVAPAAPGGTVALQRYVGALVPTGGGGPGQWSGGRWETVERKALSSTSTFRFTTHPDLAAITVPYRVRADAKPGKVAAGNSASLDVTTKHGPKITQIAAGGAHTCALNAAGAVMCWGHGGRLGNGSTAGSAFPVRVKGLRSGVTAITAGRKHTCAIAGGGAVKCWGEDVLGNGTKADSTVPVAVAGPGGAVEAISAGESHTCARYASDVVRCWGANESGQLGNGTTTFSSVPVEVTGLDAVGRLSAGGRHTCAVTEAGLLCWGANEWGQLGNGADRDDYTADPSRNSSVPVGVTGLGAGVRSVSAGGAHTCAVTAAGAVLCWGSGGMLGDATEEYDPLPDSSALPVAVTGLGSGAGEVSAGRYHSCSRSSGGAVKCWGHGDAGRAWWSGGRAALPVAVETLGSGVTGVDSGGRHSCAVTSAGAVKCWGDDTYGQRGIGPRDPAESVENVFGEQ